MTTEIIIEDVRLAVKHIVVAADRPTIVFLHDSLSCIELWRDFPKALGQEVNCNVIIYDRQGHGKSQPFGPNERSTDYLEVEADILSQLLMKFAIDDAILFGHSDGGSISLIAAAKYPEQIIGVITEGAHIFVEEISLDGIQIAIEDYKTTNLKERLQKYHGNKTEAVFWSWANTWLKDTFRQWSIESFLPQITCPVLILQGELDEFGSTLQVEGIYNQVSGTAFKLIVTATGHNPHKETAKIVIDESSKFINQIPRLVR